MHSNIFDMIYAWTVSLLSCLERWRKISGWRNVYWGNFQREPKCKDDNQKGNIKDLSDLLFQHATKELQTTCSTVCTFSLYSCQSYKKHQKATIPTMQKNSPLSPQAFKPSELHPFERQAPGFATSLRHLWSDKAANGLEPTCHQNEWCKELCCVKRGLGKSRLLTSGFHSHADNVFQTALDVTVVSFFSRARSTASGCLNSGIAVLLKKMTMA